MKLNFLIVAAFISGLILLPRAWAGDKLIQPSAQTAEFTLTVDHAEIGFWLNSKLKTEDTTVAEQTADGRIEMIAVTYELFNHNPTRKINFNEGLRFRLLDEFNNEYRQLGRPMDYDRPVRFAPAHFPSIYPDETFKETIFFEAPIKRSRTLTLLADKKNDYRNLPMEIPIPVDKIMVYDNKTQQFAVSDRFPGIKIVIPSNNTPVQPNEIINMHVLVHGVKAPDSLVVVAFNTTFEDYHPGKNNVYDLRIPADQTSGPLSVSIIGRWVGPEGQDDLVLSDNIVLNVVTPSLVSAEKAAE